VDAAEACGARYSANADSSAMTRFLLLPTPTMFTTGLCSATTGFITPLWTLRQQQCQRTIQSLSVGPTTAVHSEMLTVTMVKDRVGINAGPIERKNNSGCQPPVP